MFISLCKKSKIQTQLVIRVGTAVAWIKQIQISPNLVRNVKMTLKPIRWTKYFVFVCYYLMSLKGKEAVCPGKAVVKLSQSYDPDIYDSPIKDKHA